MKKLFRSFALCAILVVSLGAVRSDDRADWSCDPGWVAFKDEKCFKIFDNTTRTYAEAVSSCPSLADGATLPTIHSNDEQEFLSNYLFNASKMVDNFWIGSQFVNNAFEWIDKSDFSYTNWDSRGPRSRTNYCVQMQFDGGKWYDEPCERKNAFVCQKMQTWSMARLQQTLLDARKEMRDALDVANKKLDEANKKIADQKHEFDEANKKIGSLEKNLNEQKQNSIPIGFIYTQLPNEKPPASIWPSMNWADISSTYAGVFFRVNGNRSEPFGQIQEENAPRLIKIEKLYTSEGSRDLFEVNTFSESPRTSIMITGSSSSTPGYRSMSFTISGGEVRPRNMAIRMWKRTG